MSMLPQDETGCSGVRDQVVSLLRNELQEYGGLLNLLDDQQAAIVKRTPDAVLELNVEISAQVAAIQQRREARENYVAQLAVSLDQSVTSPLRGLLPSFPLPVQPLIEALIDEINRLVAHARRRAQQNQMLLARSVEVMREVLQQLHPEAMTKVYGADGRALFGVREAGGRCLGKS